MENTSPRTTTTPLTSFALVVLTLALLSGCTATPITLPFNDGGTLDAAAADGPPLGGDIYASPDSGTLPDAMPSYDAPAGDAASDAASDAVCLECPQPDGMLEGGAGDALSDFYVGDLRVGE